MRVLDITGNRYGKLLVVSRVKSRNGRGTWSCLCDCGNTVVVTQNLLATGSTKSCGCLVKKHGKRFDAVYNTWRGVKKRCNAPKHDSYPRYGERGIVYDPKWETFEGFWEDMGGSYREGLTLDRIDTNGNYCKDNCRWATKTQQGRNKSDNRLIEHNGNIHCLSEWSEITGIRADTIAARIKRGWVMEKVLTVLVENRGGCL